MELPRVAESFRWNQASWGAGLECLALSTVSHHVFSTRQLDTTSPEGIAALARHLRVERVALLSQVHGKEVQVLRQHTDLPSDRPSADVWVSNRSDVAIAVRAADCATLLLADPTTGAVAAAHAGWRGTAAGAARAAVRALGREFGARPENLLVAIGPTIGPCCYEVGPEVLQVFQASGFSEAQLGRWFGRPPTGVPNRWRLDVALANRDQLAALGVPEHHIHLSGLCTAMNTEFLPSYRVERERAPRLVAAIRATPGRSNGRRP